MGPLSANPHKHQKGVALVTYRDQTAQEHRVALLELGEDAEVSSVNSTEHRSSWMTDGDIQSEEGC